MTITPASDELIIFHEAGRKEHASYSFYRGENTNFHPNDKSLSVPGFVGTVVKGLVPDKPLITKQTKIVAFGSCFAEHISGYLHKAGYNIATKQDDIAYISRLGDGIVNTSSVLQQFEWAWEGKQPQTELWHGYDGRAFGYDDRVRLATKNVLDGTDVFIITLGLSEVWCDKITGEVFWRAIPQDKYDPARHGFRVMTQAENVQNINAIVRLIEKHRPGAKVIFSLSPIPLTATFRPMSCIVANGASKANLRSALDETGVCYFPSYEMVTTLFNHQWMEERRHVHRHVLDFIMCVFERYFCGGKSDLDVETAFRNARANDRKVGSGGHWSVGRSNLKWSKQDG